MLLLIALFIIIVRLFGLCTTGDKYGGDDRNPQNEIYRKLYNDGKDKVFPPIVTLNDIPESLPYITGAKHPKTSLHIGQRKLFLNELQFIVNNVADGPQLLIYAGATPGNKTGLLSSLCPNVKFFAG